MDRLLLDTHVLLWWLSDAPPLGKAARAKIADPSNEVFVSAVSGWEIGIKKALGKLQAPDQLVGLVVKEGFRLLPVSFAHGELAGALPQHHRDPFDRMLIAQAVAEGLTLVTRDPHMREYSVQLLAADV